MIINSYLVSPSGDADAQAFIAAAGVSDATQKAALNTLVGDLKGYSLWSKFAAIYPMVGGTATTHKYNLKDPADTDAAFRLTFSGSWTHSSNGALPDGSTAYADTHYIPATHGTNNDTHLAFYNRTNSTGGTDMGTDAATTGRYRLMIDTGSFYAQSLQYDISTATGVAAAIAADNMGLYCGSRTTSTLHKLYKNGSVLATDTSTSTGWSDLTYSIYLGAEGYQNVTAFLYSNHQCAFASMGSGLDGTESSNFYTAVQAFQTTLGRQV